MTFVATVNAVVYTGARPIFADICGLDAPWLSPDAVEAAVGERTAAIVAMHYGGHAGEIDRLEAIAQQRGLLLLEDAAHAVGSRLAGRHLGTIGSAGAFSFFSNKNLAIGEGGMAVTDDPELAARMRLLRSHGMTTLTWDRHRGHASGYDVVDLGYNYRLDEPRAALARARLARLDGENRRRRTLDVRYRELLDPISGVRSTSPPPAELQSAYHLFTILVEEGLERDKFRSALAEQGVQSSIHYPPVHGFSMYRGDGHDLSRTDGYAARTVTLPMFADMTFDQQDLVVEAASRAASLCRQR
jgi:dTDP-4-amino-4,6-dideoxygalactose transaminase